MDRLRIPTVRELMTGAVVSLRPEMTVEEAAACLIEHAISGAPVLDASGRLLGLLSEFDCLRAVAAARYAMDPHDAAATVADLMTRDCLTVAPQLDLFGLAHELVARRVRRFVVVEDGRVVGVVSRRDALRGVVRLRRGAGEGRSYPDYPEGRDPIHDYPRRR